MRRAFNAIAGKSRAILAGGLCAAVLAGCGGAENMAGTIINSGRKPIEVSPQAFQGAVYCPPLHIQSNAHLIRRYVRGKENQQDGLLYQATIAEWANNCTREGTAQTRINIGLSGHVTPGPAWQGGEIDLPIRLDIVPAGSGGKPLVSESLPVTASVPAGSARVAWTWVDNKYVVERNKEMAIKFGFVERRR